MDKTQITELSAFIARASSATYAGGGQYEKTPERLGFLELVFTDRDWQYRDSYTGFYRSSGTEVVRLREQIVWTSNYGGGMVKGAEELAVPCFDFLKQAMLAKPRDWQSFRGPHNLAEGDWVYSYEQDGDFESFSGYEEISYEGKVIFTHRIIGGLIIGK